MRAWGDRGTTPAHQHSLLLSKRRPSCKNQAPLLWLAQMAKTPSLQGLPWVRSEQDTHDYQHTPCPPACRCRTSRTLAKSVCGAACGPTLVAGGECAVIVVRP